MLVDVNGTKFNVEVEGREDAPVLMLSHSLACDLTAWDSVVPLWQDHFRIVRYDRRGHGKSEAGAPPYTLDSLAADSVGVMDALEIDKVHWCGLSIGGMIGQVLGVKYPDRFHSLTLTNTSSFISPDLLSIWEDRIASVLTGGMQAQVTPMTERWLTTETQASRPELAEHIARMITDTSIDGFIGCCDAIKDLNLTAQNAAIKLPVFVLSGAEDPGTTPEAGRVIHESIAGSRFEILPACAHQGAMEQPGAYAAAVLGFIQSLR